MTVMQEVVRRIRDIRNKYAVPPQKRLSASIKASGKDAQRLQNMTYHIQLMAGLDALAIDENAQKPKLAAVAVFEDVEIFVDGVLDPEKEKDRLQKQKENLEKRITGMQNKLNNPNYVNKAPVNIVQETREQLAELQQQLKLLNENLKALEEN